MYLLYNLALWIFSPAILVWAAWRGALGRLDGLAARFGFFNDVPDGGSPLVWLHAVSLGEMKVAGELAGRLREKIPAARFVLTASTRSGYAEARRLTAPGDLVLFPPADYAPVCRRFLRRLRPALLIVLETELWPNLFREARRFGTRLAIANGRISDRSFPRYRATRFFWKEVLAQVDMLCAQSSRDAERFAALGAPASRIHAAANLKYAIQPRAQDALADSLRQAARAAKAGSVLIAGSTMPGEETILLDTFLALRQDFPALWMILAPRHPERAAAIAVEVRSAGVPLQLRSEWRAGEAVAPGIFLLDTTGELASLYQLAALAFIGGTLVPSGGHNILEPAQYGCPTVIGPSMENFREIAAEFLAAGAVVQVNSAEQLTATLRGLLHDADQAGRIGQAARGVLDRSRRRADDIVDALAALLEAGQPSWGDARAAATPDHPMPETPMPETHSEPAAQRARLADK